jgi:hypothetical protein
MGEVETKFRWDEQRMKENEQFQDALNKTELRDKIFTEKFIEGLEKRRDALEARSNKVSLVQLTMSLLLVIALALPDMSVSAVGLSAKAANFREIILVIMTSIQIYGMAPAIDQARITDAMHLFLQKQAAGDPTVLRLLKLRYGLSTGFQTVDMTGRTFSKLQKIHLVFGGVAMLLWIVSMFVFFVLLEIAGLISILINPTISLGASVLLCLYVIIVTLTNFSIRGFAGIGSNARSPDKL